MKNSTAIIADFGGKRRDRDSAQKVEPHRHCHPSPLPKVKRWLGRVIFGGRVGQWEGRSASGGGADTGYFNREAIGLQSANPIETTIYLATRT
jgi:hypothetical protein